MNQPSHHGSIVEYVRYAVPPERAQALIDAYRRTLPILRASPNCISAELTRGADQPERFVLRLEWDSAEGHLDGFRKSELFRDFLVEVRPFIEDLEEMAHYQPTGVALSKPRSLYDALGGVEAMFRIAAAMHHAMAHDELLGARFRDAAPSHVPHLAMWLTEVFGGPKLYSETLGDIAPMLARHARGAFSEAERARFVELARSAAAAHVPTEQPRALEAFARYIEWGSRVAVENSRPDHVPDPAAGVPTWSWDA